MTRDHWALLAGVAVLFAGLFIVAAWSRVPDPASGQASSVAAPATTMTPSPPTTDLPGVPLAVQRVLFESGSAASIDSAAAHVPPTVARVLRDYDVPLMIPTGAGAGQ